jgi:hypothetical protein
LNSAQVPRLRAARSLGFGLARCDSVRRSACYVSLGSPCPPTPASELNSP